MNVSTRFLVLSVFSSVLSATAVAKEVQKGSVFWFVYDVTAPRALTLCTDLTTNHPRCKPWDATKQAFPSGSVIRVKVVNGRFRSTFKVSVNGVPLTEDIPQVRGLTEAPPAKQTSGPQAAALAAAKPEVLDQIPEKASEQLEEQYNKASDSIADVERWLGFEPRTIDRKQDRECSAQTFAANANLLSSRVGDIRTFAEQLTVDARICEMTYRDKFSDEATFNNLTARADALIQAIKILNTDLPAQSEISAEVNTATEDFSAFADLATQFRNKFEDKYVASATYLPHGVKYQDLSRRMEGIKTASSLMSKYIAEINDAMSKAFPIINALYYRSRKEFDVLVGQYNSNYVASFSVSEITNFVPYKAAPAKEAADKQGKKDPANQTNPAPVIPPANVPDPSKPSADHPNTLYSAPVGSIRLLPVALTSLAETTDDSSSPCPKSATPDCNQPCCSQSCCCCNQLCQKSTSNSNCNQQSTNPGKIILSGNFDVHKMYRANLVAGFFVSSLHNRQFGLTNNGQATSSTNVTFVTVTGNPYRPQFHAFAGVNVYLWRRDVFPGALSKDHGYWKPGLLFGYGLDALNNYIVGLNWETKWGINVSGGGHIGQETRLQPGIVPGVTQLSSSATAAPTFNKTEYGYYGSVGFDLAVMKNAISQLFGGGGSTAGK
jgi:hypothetical protein